MNVGRSEGAAGIMSGDVRISAQLGSLPAVSNNSRSGSGQIWVGEQQQQHFDPAFVISHSGRGLGTSLQQQSAAQAFFAKKNPKSQHGSSQGTLPLCRPRHNDDSDTEDSRVGGRQETATNFSTILSKCPPPPPPSLIKKIHEPKDNAAAVGKVKVILRVANSGVIDEGKSSFFKMDKKKKQVTLLGPDNQRESEHQEEPSSSASGDQKRSLDVSAPKMFAFDGLFTDEDSQNDLSSSALTDILHSVVNGSDGTLFCFGHANLGKSFTMIGSDESSRTVGVIPTAISWLFKAIKERKDRTGARVSVRVSAAEIRTQGQEEMRDLLSGMDSGSGTRQARGLSVQNLCEMRASSAEKAGYYLDCALSSRSVDSQGRDSHFVYSLHLYQHNVASEESKQNQSTANILLGGRSRLHLIDFGSCERTKTLGGSITIAGLGNVILGILNGQRHLPFKESKVTQLLREVLGSVSCQVALVAHLSPEPSHYSETLHTIQLASRIHRMRRKKMKMGGGSGTGSGSGGSSDENKRGRFHRDSGRSSSDMTTSTDPSSSEQSCDTVIYVGPRDDDGTDCESPPVYLPSLNSGDHRAVMSKVLKGSTAELPPTRYRSLDRKSARSPMSPLLQCSPRSPSSSQHSTPIKTLSGCLKSPSNTGSLPRNPRGKMPLFGKVAGYRQPPVVVATDHGGHQHSSPGHRLSVASGGGRSRLSDTPSHLLPHPGYPSPTPPHEIWVDSKPNCDKDVVNNAAGGVPGSPLPQQYDTNAIYGYMDEHKKQMIQQWVEGQSISSGHSQAPPSHLTGKDSLAWLEAQSEASQQFRCLTQFKVAESSVESEDSDPRLGDDCDDEMALNNDPSVPECGQEMKTRTDPDNHHPTESSHTGVGNKSEHINNLPDKPDKITPPPPASLGEQPSQTCQREMGNKCIEGETGKTLPSATKRAEKEPQLGKDMIHCDMGSVASKSSTTSSKKSDVGTNTDTSHNIAALQSFSPRHQDPFGASRKLTLRRTSGQEPNPDDETGIRTLDELYSHCEQLVETLSQASEELRACSQQEESVHQSDSNGIDKIDDIEIYEVSEGSEASVEVSDIGCQANEEDIALSFGPSCLGSDQQHLQRILSQENHLSATNGCCPLSTVSDERQNCDKQLSRIISKETVQEREPCKYVQDVTMSDFDNVCEELTHFSDHEEFFNKKFDQLEKLHELYKSVSSISAASQSRLELNNQNRTYENKNLLHQRSASFSLTGLMLGDLDNLSLPSTVSDDINSLCSEPAWLTSSRQQQQCLDINRNSTSCTNSALDLANILQGLEGGPGSALSLSQLMGGHSTDPGITDGLMNKPTHFSAANAAGLDTQDRSDSPILEGLDSDLAKYAQLKDLEQAYKPKNDNNHVCDNQHLQSLRHPDGASNPDLSPMPCHDTMSPLSMPAATLPRRSPGTGRSSSGSDAEMELAGEKRQKSSVGTRTEWGQQKDNFSGVPGSNDKIVTTAPAKLSSSPASTKTKSDNLAPASTASEKNNCKDQKTGRIPKFSRLFGNVKKISRSPTQITKQEKSRSKASKRQTKTSSQSSLKDPGQLKSAENLITEKPAKSKYRFFEKREKCFAKSPAVNVSKNVKGTLSSEQLFEKPKSTKSSKNSPLLFAKSDKKKDKVKTKSQGVCAVSCLPPSPYSTPGKVKTKRTVSRSQASSLSGYDSGIELGGGAVVAGIKSSSLVKIRGKGADTMIIGNHSHNNATTLQRRSSRSNCKSSGYESIGLESESTSVDSYHGTLGTPNQDSDTAGAVPSNSQQILQYDSDTVTRMDRHWRFQEIKRLKKKQEHLKGELLSAKTRINSDPDNWSYELHTEASGLDHTDPNFVEAFEKETVILDKRVAACKSHVVVSTSFVNKSSSNGKETLGCTADCEQYAHEQHSRQHASKATGHL